MTLIPFESKKISLVTKSTPLPYFRIQLKAYCLPGISLLRSVTSIQKQHQHPEYLWGHMVDLSSIVLLDSAKVGFPKQFSANGH
jgi:hypothetical protein